LAVDPKENAKATDATAVTVFSFVFNDIALVSTSILVPDIRQRASS
jgi:hypothetical protein